MSNSRSTGTKPVVLLAIDAKWADAILEGTKRWEYRRSPPALEPPYTMFLYATQPAAELRGAALVDKHLRDNRSVVAKMTVEDTPQTTGDLLEYFEGQQEAHALRVRHWLPFEPPISVDTIEAHWPNFTVPQNFRYLDRHDFPELAQLAHERIVWVRDS